MSPLALSLRFLQTQPDARLVALARDGHERAFEALIRRYRSSLHAYCRRLCGADGSADDVLQQALLHAWTALAAGAEVREPKSWLFRIVHNVAVSDSRRARVIQFDRHAAAARGADQEAEQQMEVRDALAAVAALPGLQRDVMLATAVDGMSHHELASALGMSSGAVRGLIYRARAAIRSAAAAVIPAPVIEWAARQGRISQASPLYELIAGGGSAGVAGVLLKGGAIVATAGALATAVGIASAPASRPHHAASAHRQSALPAQAGDDLGAARPVLGDRRTANLAREVRVAHTATDAAERGASNTPGGPGSGRDSSGHSGRDGGRGGSGSALISPTSGHTDGGGASGSSTASTGSDGGSGSMTTAVVSTSSSDGGSNGPDGGSMTTTVASSSDGGSGGSGSDGAATTTLTTSSGR